MGPPQQPPPPPVVPRSTSNAPPPHGGREDRFSTPSPHHPHPSAAKNRRNRSTSPSSGAGAGAGARTDREAPWLRDHRRTPRSVRTTTATTTATKSPTTSKNRRLHNNNNNNRINPFDASPSTATAASSSANSLISSSTTSSSSSFGGRRRARQHDTSTPTLPTFSPRPQMRMMPPQQHQQQRQPPYNGRGAANHMNPLFDASSSESFGGVGGVNRERQTPPTPAYRNPFDSPLPDSRSRVPAAQDHHSQNHNPFGGSTPSPPPPQPSTSQIQQQQKQQQQQQQQQQQPQHQRPTVRVTVHEDRTSRVSGGGMRILPLSPKSTSKTPVSDSLSAALDSLEQILDQTHGSTDDGDGYGYYPGEVYEERHHAAYHGGHDTDAPSGGDRAVLMGGGGGGGGGGHRHVSPRGPANVPMNRQGDDDDVKRVVSMAMPRGMDRAISSSTTQSSSSPRQLYTPPPYGRTTPSPRQLHSQDPTSPKAQQAAERLQQSFDQRRRQRSRSQEGRDGRSGSGVADNDDEVNQTPRGWNHEGYQAGVVSGNNNNNNGEEDTVSDDLVFEYTKTEDTENTHSARTLEVIEEKKVDDPQEDEGAHDEARKEEVTKYEERPESYADDFFNYSLHDLCDEAPRTDDIAWHNALFLLAVNPELAELKEPECHMTPLHVACLANEPPPLWMIRGLLYTFPSACQEPDKGGRLPLHLLAATSADVDTIRLLVEEYPPSVAHKDERGFTPIHLLLKNDRIQLTLDHLRLLLGQVEYGRSVNSHDDRRFSFRRGDHLNLNLSNLDCVGKEREERHELQFRQYQDDVRRALTKITQWKRRQVNKNANSSTPTSQFMSKEEHFLRSKEASYPNPASIATPSGRLLPLHLLLRRKTKHQENRSFSLIELATPVELLRVLVVAYPLGLVAQDVNGKTPVMTALLQPDTTPEDEVIELLLGLRTPGFDGFNRERPAVLSTNDSHQLPLHVAAEELVSNFSILNTICDAYPDARTVQDIRGRTPLHLALQNFRSFPVDAATLALLFVAQVAKIRDNNGNTPFDLLVQNPRCVKEPRHSSTKTNGDDLSFQQFLDASIERPRNSRQAQSLLQSLRSMPSWLRRHACAARFVQDLLLEEMASPFNTFRIMAHGFVLVVLLALLRRMLHVNDNLSILIYYLATYHLTMQIICWFTAMALGEFLRLCLANPWRWVDLATGILAILAADFSSRGDVLLSSMGASATAACWLSLIGYLVDWWCGAAVFVGSATRLLYFLLWPFCLAAMGIVAASQVLYTLQDCSNGGICSLSDAYTFVYWMILGQPVLSDETDFSTGTLATIIVFTILSLWWIVSIFATTITETTQLNRHHLALRWYWEPKVSLTFTAIGGKDSTVRCIGTLTDKYCQGMADLWCVMTSALLGNRFETHHWYSYCLRSNAMAALSRFVALVVIPLWLLLGLVTLGILWPPQVRRWLFCLGGSTPQQKDSSTLESDLARAKLSQLRADVVELKASTYDQGAEVQRDLALIKDVLFRALTDDGSMTQG